MRFQNIQTCNRSLRILLRTIFLLFHFQNKLECLHHSKNMKIFVSYLKFEALCDGPLWQVNHQARLTIFQKTNTLAYFAEALISTSVSFNFLFKIQKFFQLQSAQWFVTIVLRPQFTNVRNRVECLFLAKPFQPSLMQIQV